MDNPSATSAQVTLKVGDKVLTEPSPVVDGFLLIATHRDPARTNAWDDNNVFLEKIVTYDASGNEDRDVDESMPDACRHSLLWMRRR